jgi:hypothetical protein
LGEAEVRVNSSAHTPNENSTCEWVDEAYSRRLWGQLVKRADLAAKATGTLWTARQYGWCLKKAGGGHDYGGWFLLPGPGSMLDFVFIGFTRNGHRIAPPATLMRISEHAGQRLFERLRTNSAEDLMNTLGIALVHYSRVTDREYPRLEDDSLSLPWGTLHGVVDQSVWTAKTFIPTKATA